MDGNRSAERPVALITGASSGIGAEFARQLGRKGFDLILVARRRDRLEAVASELGRGGTGTEVLVADLAEESGIREVERRITEEERLEILVNNAGFGSRGLFHEADAEGQARMHRLHVLATVRLTRAALPGMVRRNRGAIINVSSVAAFNVTPGNVSYCATKAWMNRFTEGLALELRMCGSRVKVQALCPGFTRTEFHEAMGVGRDFIGEGWWMEPAEVVRASLEGLSKGKLMVIPGWRYKAVVWVSRAMPRWAIGMAAAAYARRTGRLVGWRK